MLAADLLRSDRLSGAVHAVAAVGALLNVGGAQFLHAVLLLPRLALLESLALLLRRRRGRLGGGSTGGCPAGCYVLITLNEARDDVDGVLLLLADRPSPLTRSGITLFIVEALGSLGLAPRSDRCVLILSVGGHGVLSAPLHFLLLIFPVHALSLIV